MEIIKLKVNDLIPYKGNAKLHPKEQIEQIKNSILEFGMNDPIAIDENNVIIEGHGRLLALKELNVDEVNCIRLSHLPEELKRMYMLAHNKTTLNSYFDLDALKLELEFLLATGLDVTLTGFDMDEINKLFGELVSKEDDFDAEKAAAEIKTPITKLGDIWLLGKHRLICGDSTAIPAYTFLMNGQEADMVLTDPPYNTDYEGGTKEKLKILNDKMSDTQFLDFLTAAFTRMNEFSKKGAAIYVFHSDSEGYNFRVGFKLAGYKLRQSLVWEKNAMVMGRQDYQWRHEPILYAWKEGASHNWYSDRKQTTIINFDKPLRNSDHPTMKPIGLCAYFITNSSKEGDIVLDPFGGSGSTLIACEQLKNLLYCRVGPKIL